MVQMAETHNHIVSAGTETPADATFVVEKVTAKHDYTRCVQEFKCSQMKNLNCWRCSSSYRSTRTDPSSLSLF